MKRKAPTATTDSEPPAKRQKVSNPSKPSKPSKPSRQSNRFSSNEMKQLLQLFNHLQSQGIQNQTLDRCIYDSYQILSKQLNKEDKNQFEITKEMSNIRDIVINKTIIPSNIFFEQMIELKAQIKAIRLLSRDIGLSSTISDLSHGIDNPHSWQRPYIDPLRTENPSICKHSKYNLEKEREGMEHKMDKMDEMDEMDEIIIDSSPQTIEELVYQKEYDGMKKLVQRRRMLKDYLSRCESIKSKNKNNKNKHNNFDVAMYKKSRDELQLLDLCELQNKIRNEILHSRLDRVVYERDNGDNEALLNPDLFVRTAQIGLHFDPHINSANHPPTMATSNHTFPFYYEGQR